jgi:hypothetical protein
MHFIICDRLQRFNGLKELLLAQDMFEKVSFVHEIQEPVRAVLIDDTGREDGYGQDPIVCHKYYNFIKDTNQIDFRIDSEFELQVPKLDIDFHQDKFLVGDRWSAKDAPDVDTRKGSNVLEDSGILDKDKVLYLDYTKDLVYNCSLIKYNTKPFLSTVTGIAILADMMNREVVVLWDDEYEKIWPGISGETVDKIYDLHHYKNRKVRMEYLNSFKL